MQPIPYLYSKHIASWVPFLLVNGMGTRAHSDIFLSTLNGQILVRTVRFTKSGPIFPNKWQCTVSAGRVIALMFGIIAGILLLLIIGLHFRQRSTLGLRDVSLNDEEELEQLEQVLPAGAPDSEDQAPLPLPPVPPKDNDGTKGTFSGDSLGYGGSRDEPPPPYIKE
ncbi:hypothetical protein F5146DRAFT_518679 [Armillaria mellea]|nr:hypothetical protein F5146DRAFT_518679 [Armillaria mellea]